MPLNRNEKVKGARKALPPVTAGTYMGRIVQIVDVGMQPQEDYQTKEAKDPKEILMVAVEFPKLRLETDEGDKPRWLSKQFKLIDESNPYYANSSVAKVLDPLLNGSKDFGDLINVAVMCNIGHTSGGNPKIISMSAAPEEIPVPDLENNPAVFDFYSPDIDIFKDLPPWIQRICAGSIDYEGSDLQTLVDVSGVDVS